MVRGREYLLSLIVHRYQYRPSGTWVYSAKAVFSNAGNLEEVAVTLSLPPSSEFDARFQPSGRGARLVDCPQVKDLPSSATSTRTRNSSWSTAEVRVLSKKPKRSVDTTRESSNYQNTVME